VAGKEESSFFLVFFVVALSFSLISHFLFVSSLDSFAVTTVFFRSFSLSALRVGFVSVVDSTFSEHSIPPCVCVGD
jgi:hypothetical protein